jgi:hypothetical protein
MAEQANRVRLVPKDRNPYDETAALIERLGWEPSDDSSDDLVEWSVPGQDAVVRWVADADTGVHFFVVEGSDRGQVAKQIEESIDMLGVDDFESYLSRFHGAQGLIRGLYTAAAAAPERCDARVLELFQRYLAHDDPLIRRAALLASSIMAWPEWHGPVSRLRDDPDPAVQEAAEAAQRSLKTPG